MPRFGKKSMERLSTAHPLLQALFLEVVKRFDCTILCGARGEEEQNAMFEADKSRVRFPRSSHNRKPFSMAVDAGPWPLDWDDVKQFGYLAGYVRAKAEEMGIPIRWGGDWDGDFETQDNKFNDLPHYELIEKLITPELLMRFGVAEYESAGKTASDEEFVR